MYRLTDRGPKARTSCGAGVKKCPSAKEISMNPLGLDGFEFIEFCAPQKGPLEAIFSAMGFALVARHRSKDVDLWRQGEINCVINYEPRSAAAYFAAEHGPSV